MINLLISSLLIAAATLGQTPAQAPKGSATKTTSGSAGSTAKMTKPIASSATKPVPQTTRSQQLQSGDSNIPSYRMEKDKGVRKGRNRYPAKDTKNQS